MRDLKEVRFQDRNVLITELTLYEEDKKDGLMYYNIVGDSMGRPVAINKTFTHDSWGTLITTKPIPLPGHSQELILSNQAIEEFMQPGKDLIQCWYYSNKTL